MSTIMHSYFISTFASSLPDRIMIDHAVTILMDAKEKQQESQCCKGRLWHCLKCPASFFNRQKLEAMQARDMT